MDEMAGYLKRWCKQGRRDRWRDLVTQLYVPAQGDLDLVHGAPAGHEWFRLPSYDGYLVACSCGWHGIETDNLGRMLSQVKDHLGIGREHGTG